jgi:hypothetical protein
VSDRPRNIVLFEWLLYGSFGMRLILGPLNASVYPNMKIDIGWLLNALPIVAFLCCMVWLVAHRGRRWPIWIFIIGFLYDLPFSLRDIADVYYVPSAVTLSIATLILVRAAMQVSAILLLFFGTGEPWFGPGVRRALGEWLVRRGLREWLPRF